jgi:hypothetical protein
MNGMCNAQFIHVIGQTAGDKSQTDCHTFELKNIRSSTTSITNVNITGAVEQIFTEDPVMNPELKCSVKTCVYNLSERCTADDIYVNGPDSSTIQQTECLTFRKR